MLLRDLLRVIRVVAIAMLAIFSLIGTSGWLAFTNAHIDPLQRADAVVVLAGQHDGREDYGILLAKSGWAHTVVLSNPYPDSDPVMRRVCNQRADRIEIICLPPPQITTRGEAELVRTVAAQRSWRKIIVVTWRYHLPRARLVFQQCFANRADAVVMRPVPSSYESFSMVRWAYIYTYQYGALVKAAVLGDCTG